MTTSNAPVRSSPDPASFVAAVARLRAEQEVASTSQAQALLFHEMGVLEERHGDEAAAARDHLAAVNCDPDFREPLERLIAIVERRQSYKNLGKLLERLVRVAETPTERARALVDEATHFADFDSNFDAARSSLQEAAENAPEDVTLWLALERVAARMADPSLSERALMSRAELVQDPTLRGLLLVDIAEGRAAQGDLDGAFEALDRAIGQGGEATFLAMLAEERIARDHGRADVEAKVLEMQGELVLMAMTDAQAGDTYGVPRHKRHPGAVGDAWLRAAELYRRQGDAAKTTTLLERAISELASEPSILHARLCLAEASSDRATAARLARAELEHGMTGEVGASLWLRVAEAAAAEEQIPDALEALGKALSLAPGSIEARALDLDLLAARGEPGQLAAALEATAEQLELDSAKANYYLAAADVWARLAKDVSGAKAALSQAGMFGLSKMLSARAARMLASLLGDTNWYEEATRRLLAQGATEEEQADLWLELVRLRLLRKDTESARHALNSAAQTPSGAFLSRLLAAYALPWTQSGDAPAQAEPGGATLFTELAELEPEPELARGLRVIAARRALERGEVARATETLSALQREDGSDLVLTGALSASFAAQDQAAKVRDVFEQAAQNCHDPELAAALHAAAFVLSWKVGERARALSALQKASDEQPATFGPLLGSALRAAGADDASARERAHEALASADPALAALERFGLEVGGDGSETTAWEALIELRVATDSELGRAGELARALWSPTGGDGASRREALESLAEHGGEAARLAQALLHQLTLSEEGDLPDPSRVLESAERLARADSSAVSALEWLAAAIAAQEHDQEIQARLALAARVTEPLSSAISSSAALMAELLGTGENASVRSDSPAARLTNLELAVPGQDPARRAHALAAAAPLIGEDSEPLVLALAGFNQLAAGDIQGAVKSFRTVVDTYPDEVIGWEGLRAAALADGDRATLAEACAALGDAVGDAGLGAKLWEEAAAILIDELSDPVRGEFALTRATERDIGLFSAFDRLFRMLRARKDAPRLLALIEQRLTVASDPQEVLRLVWERARALRESGDREGALAALQKVRELEPDHVGALALTGEICITLHRYEEAAEHLARLAAHPSAPQQQRLMSGVAAVDLYESRLKNPSRALEVLTGLYRGGLSTLPVRERLARTATRVGAYDEATEVLEVLMEERETPAGRIEAARLAMVIYRDELGMPEGAQEAVKRLLRESADDGEALDLVLTSVFAESVTKELLGRGLRTLIAALQNNPIDVDRVERVARIAERLDRVPLRQVALGALVSLGRDATLIDPELARLDERVAHVPRIQIDEAALPQLFDAEDQGPAANLMAALADTIADAIGPNLTALGVTKRERVDPRSGLALRNEVAAWAGALGIGEFELYVGGADADGVHVVPGDPPSVVVGRNVTAPLGPYHRQAVAREFLALKRGTTVLRHRDPEAVHALLVAACRVAEVPIDSPPFALLPDFQRQLAREMPRRVRKILPDLARAFQASGQDPAAWYRAATSTLDRMAALSAGDVSWVLAADPRQRGRLSASLEGERRARRILAFVWSPSYLELREKLGMGVR